MIVLLIAGSVAILAGLAAIGFGIPVKEFGFGNTLILTGTVGACTGLMMISLALVVGELKKLAPRLGAAGPVPDSRLPPRDIERSAADDAEDEEDAPAPGREPALFSRDQPALARSTGPEPGVPPWQDEVLRDRERLAAAAAAEPPAQEEPKRRNLLFQSSRRERDAAAGVPQLPLVPAAEPEAPQPKNFEDAWPQTERPRSEAIRRAARAPYGAGDKLPDAALIPDRYVPPAPAEEPRLPERKAPDVTVLKSGIVDGMAYSLYSDGSIEAQMPEGRMHFSSIDELREHLDNRG